jgi:hypothetical protein
LQQPLKVFLLRRHVEILVHVLESLMVTLVFAAVLQVQILLVA